MPLFRPADDMAELADRFRIAGRIILLAAVALVAFFVGRATAAEQDRGAWFKSLKQPTTGLSCCDISDCARTEADWQEGQWWAKVRGLKRPIPPEKVLIAPHTIDGEAYVCAQNPTAGVSPDKLTIYCFIPPTMGF